MTFDLHLFPYRLSYHLEHTFLAITLSLFEVGVSNFTEWCDSSVAWSLVTFSAVEIVYGSENEFSAIFCDLLKLHVSDIKHRCNSSRVTMWVH